VKKICFIIPSLKAGGGSERIISELANYSASFDNFKVHLVLLIKDRHFYKISDKISVHEPDFNHSNHSRLVFSAKIIWYLRKETIDIAPDVILSFEEMYNSFVLLALLRLKIRIYISDRCQPESYWGIFHKVMKRIIYPTSYGIIAQTEMAKKILYKQIKHNNIIVIANPILDAYKPGTAKENIILNVGRLIKSKQHNVLLRIFAQTNNKGWKLIIAGDGP